MHFAPRSLQDGLSRHDEGWVQTGCLVPYDGVTEVYVDDLTRGRH
ncbi:MAG TPA: hypothetical protein VFU19_01085 [Iamia sp.]|nr:hypothetical protein [Iamia sp.]